MATAAISSDTAREVPTAPAMAGEVVRLSGVSWQTFEGLSGRTRGGRLTYDRGELEIMSPSLRHEDYKGHLREFVRIAAEELGWEIVEMGSTTWKAPQVERGFEADESFYLDPEKIERAAELSSRGLDDITAYPAPDLVIEIDLRRPDLDRSAAYAAVGVAEVWRFDGGALVIERLNPLGIYEVSEMSGLFPVRADEISTLIAGDSPLKAMARSRRMREWVRRELVPRVGKAE